MNAIRVRKHIDSEVLHLPELQEMIGRDVEIIILSRDLGEEGPIETLDTFLGDSLARPAPSPVEMEALRLAARSDPSLAAALAIAESGGLDVDAIVTARAESRR
jgi:hypothetical protein